jgi:hypothetical protein
MASAERNICAIAGDTTKIREIPLAPIRKVGRKLSYRAKAPDAMTFARRAADGALGMTNGEAISVRN